METFKVLKLNLRLIPYPKSIFKEDKRYRNGQRLVGHENKVGYEGTITIENIGKKVNTGDVFNLEGFGVFMCTSIFISEAICRSVKSVEEISKLDIDVSNLVCTPVGKLFREY